MRNRLLLFTTIGLAACSAVEAPPSNEQPAQIEAPIPATWERRQLYFANAGIRRDNAKPALERIGARDVSVTGTQVSFSVLVPIRSENPASEKAPIVKAHWEKVTFRVNSGKGRYYADGVSAYIYEQLQHGILALFTTRNLAEKSGRRLSVEVLYPVRETAP